MIYFGSYYLIIFIPFYSQVGDRFGLNRGNACRTIQKYVRALSNLLDEFIIWPRGSLETSRS